MSTGDDDQTHSRPDIEDGANRRPNYMGVSCFAWRGTRGDPVCPQGVNTPDVGANRDGPEPDEECPQPDEEGEGEEAQQFAQFERRMLHLRRMLQGQTAYISTCRGKLSIF